MIRSQYPTDRVTVCITAPGRIAVATKHISLRADATSDRDRRTTEAGSVEEDCSEPVFYLLQFSSMRVVELRSK